MNDELTTIKSMILDLDKQQHEHYKKIEANQSKILGKVNVLANKNIVILLLVGIILGLNIYHFNDIVIRFLQPAIDLIRTILKLGE